MMHSWRTGSILALLFVVAGMAVFSAACGGSSGTTDVSATPTAAAATAAATPTGGPAGPESEHEQTVTVSLLEWKITGANGAPLGPLTAGEIKFDVHNDGTTQHEFVLIKTDADPGSLPVDGGEVNEDTAGESPGEADDIDPGQSKTATMRLEPGKYVYICNVAGHYQAGMRGQLIVQ